MFCFLSNNFFNMLQQRSFTRLKPRLPFLLMISELSVKSILQYSAFGFFAFLLLAFFLLFYLLVTREFVFSFGPRFADLYSGQFAFLFFFCGMCFFQFSFDLRKSPCFISFSNSLLRSRLPPLDFLLKLDVLFFCPIIFSICVSNVHLRG